MQKLSRQAFEEIRRWMYRNARPLELARWQVYFEDGNVDSVLRALTAFQNEDGGFGHAIDCDNLNPNSTPYNAGVAIGIFRELGIYDPHHPLVSKTLAYLDNTPFFSEKGWPFTIPSNGDYPHAPWWTYSEENNAENLYHVTGGLVGYILHCGDKMSRLYQKALSVADGMMDDLRQKDMMEVHDVNAYCILLHDIQAAELADRFDIAYLTERLRVMVNAAIERDPAKWPFYSMRPSTYIDSAESMFYPGNEEVVSEELDYILSTRHDGGVWDITWTWGDHPKEFAISERWWQGFWAIRNLLILKSYDRLS
ncbi:hypothetical protein [Gorillibacterium massiliense]|uniref:hypothetical protein n=1 Tax=Gorillibacterium massiliense TaxID=1280390 RepID=UPI0004BB29CE|nr:hypothetical protein [Gorillibacterium massiliense]